MQSHVVRGGWLSYNRRLTIVKSHYPLLNLEGQECIARESFLACARYVDSRDNYPERKTFAARIMRDGYSQKMSNMIAEMLSV